MNNMRKGFTLTEVLVAGLISAVVIGLVSVALNTYNRISSKMTERAAINYEVNYVDDLCQSIVKYINADDGITLEIEDGATLTGFPKAANQTASTATEISDLKSDFNDLLAKLKTAGLMEADS